MSMRDERRSLTRVAGLVVAAALFVAAPLAVITMGKAEAQTTPACDYPFEDCPTTTTTSPRTLSFFINLRIAIAGQPIRILVCGVENGTVVRFTFAGILMTTEVGRDAPPRSCTQNDVALPAPAPEAGGVFAAIIPSRLFGGVRAQSSQVPYVETTFNAPNLSPDTYPVCALAAGYDAACADVQLVADADVLGRTFSRSGDSTASGTTTNGSTGSTSGTRVLGRTFARTGAAILFLTLLGLGLVIVGRRLRRAAS